MFKQRARTKRTATLAAKKIALCCPSEREKKDARHRYALFPMVMPLPARARRVEKVREAPGYKKSAAVAGGNWRARQLDSRTMANRIEASLPYGGFPPD